MLMGWPSLFLEDYGQQCGFLHTNYSVSLSFSMKWQFFIGLWLKIGHPCRLSFRSLGVRHLICIATGCHRWQIAKIFEIFHATHCSLESPCWPTLISAAQHLYQQDTLTRWRSFQSFFNLMFPASFSMKFLLLTSTDGTSFCYCSAGN